jgi:hypothetical protein
MKKSPNKSQRELPQAPEKSKHKKKSQGTKQVPWPKHKHEYQDVLLEHIHFSYHLQRSSLSRYPSKVCKICGRIGETCKDEKYYTEKVLTGLPYLIREKQLTEEALKLPVYHYDNYLDKQAIEGPVEYNV